MVLLSTALSAQSTYFQQEVNYSIEVTLDDVAHTLKGRVRMEYVNHSPDTLREIWMHLWPNAYRSRKTAFCRQKLRLGNMAFYFAPDSLLGYIDGLDFRVNQQPVTWKYHPEHIDIALLTLPTPLPPGGRVDIETPFLVKIPGSFSRLGHVGQSYQISQWYPKPAVYDRKGWHPMPYLDQGEFYSEFGTYEVALTLPANYVVGATGVLQTPEERAFLEQKIAETTEELANLASLEERVKEEPFPPSSPVMKTIRYRAERVHDFAWFADKRFRVQRELWTAPSGQTVECWAMFPKDQMRLWRRAAFFVRRAVQFYSEHVGEYPWPQATAVSGALSAGGGMEYPMVTVIGGAGTESYLDQVITHEVGHNWFYGILATHERDYPWMDEGLNSYYERRYMQQYYGSSDPSEGELSQILSSNRVGSLSELLVVTLARLGADLPSETNSDAFSSLGYFAQVYMKPALCLRWLEHSVGRPLFDRAMQQYYQRWQFKHPYPEDLRAAWKEAGVQADWFFEAMQARRFFDGSIRKVRKLPDGTIALKVRNRGGLSAPFSISAVQQGKVVHTEAYLPSKERTITARFPALSADAFVLDQERVTLDIYRSNNTRRMKGLLPGLLLPKWQFIALAERSDRTVVGAAPWVGWNVYDKTTVGLALHSSLLPPQRWRYLLLPGFGFGSKNVVGMAEVQYRWSLGRWAPNTVAGIQLRTATYDHRLEEGAAMYRLQYFRWMPFLRLDLRSPSTAFDHSLHLRAILLQKEEPLFSNAGSFTGKSRPSAQIYEMRYEARNRALPNPYEMAVTLEGQRYSVQGTPASYLRASLEWAQTFYYRPKKGLSLRLFGGYFFHNTQRHRGAVATNSLNNDVARASFALNPQGFNDYRFDQFFVGRSEVRGFWSRQVIQAEGGFKNALGRPFAQVFGNSNDFIVALNLRADLPFRLPSILSLKPYFDVGYFRDATPLGSGRSLEEQLVWSGGVVFEVLKGRLEFYFPLLNSSYLNQLYRSATDNYWQRISWSVRLQRIRWRDVEQLLVQGL